MHVYIYIQKEKYGNIFIYNKSDTPQKSRQFKVLFDIKNPDTLLYAILDESSEVDILYKNYDNLCYVKIIYTNIHTLLKKQDTLRYVFIYKNLDTLRYAIFR